MPVFLALSTRPRVLRCLRSDSGELPSLISRPSPPPRPFRRDSGGASYGEHHVSGTGRAARTRRGDTLESALRCAFDPTDSRLRFNVRRKRVALRRALDATVGELRDARLSRLVAVSPSAPRPFSDFSPRNLARPLGINYN